MLDSEFESIQMVAWSKEVCDMPEFCWNVEFTSILPLFFIYTVTSYIL